MGKSTIVHGKIHYFYGKMFDTTYHPIYDLYMMIYPLVMTNSSPWFFDGPNRNRWFTELKNGDVPWLC